MAGILAGFLSDKKTAGTDAGNALGLNAEDSQLAQGQLGQLLRYQDDPNIVDPIKGSQTATDQVQNNNILGQVFGKDGTMSRTANEEKDLASRGFSLRPEDHEAYGQASDNIARMFGNQEGNLAQALASRGLSNSAGANQSFSGLQGNKMEQLGQMQRKIADDRMKMNMERLGQTRQFLGQLTNEGGQQIQNQFGRQMEGANTQFSRLMDKNNAAQSRLTGMQDQSNEQLMQRQKTQTMPGWASGLSNLSNMGSNVLTSWATSGQGKNSDKSAGADKDKEYSYGASGRGGNTQPSTGSGNGRT